MTRPPRNRRNNSATTTPSLLTQQASQHSVPDTGQQHNTTHTPTRSAKPQHASRASHLAQTPTARLSPLRNSSSKSTVTPAKSKRAIPINATTPSKQGGMSLADRLAWNLRILRRHDPYISRVLDQAPHANLYRFEFENEEDRQQPVIDGKPTRYKGSWAQTGTMGTVFIVERSQWPVYGIFLLNRGGTSSLAQMFHSTDKITLGDDDHFFNLKPMKWDGARTPYDVPYVETQYPEVLCLWLSQDGASVRFKALFEKMKPVLAWYERHHTEPEDIVPSSPCPSDLDDLWAYRSDEDVTDEESDNDSNDNQLQASTATESSHTSSPPATQAKPPAPRPLDKLFATFIKPSSETSAPVSTPPTQQTSTITTTTTLHTISTTKTPSTTSTTNVNGSTSFSITSNLPLNGVRRPSITGRSYSEMPISPTQPSHRGQDLLQSLLEPLALRTPQPSNTNATPNGRSLLDDLFASAAAASTRNEEAPLPPTAAPPNGAASPPSLLDQLMGSSKPANVPAQPGPEPVTPPSRFAPARVHSIAEEGEDDDEVVLMSDRSHGATARPLTATTPISQFSSQSTPQQNGEISSLAPVPPAPEDESVFKESASGELKPPSPSLIPNPLHTPAFKNASAIAISRRQRRLGKAQETQSLGESRVTSLGEDLGTLPAIREKGKGKQKPKEQYIPRSDQEKDMESGLDLVRNEIGQAIVEAHAAQTNGQGPKAVLSRNDFVREVLTLIHKEPAFVDDLYARYQNLLTH